MTSRQLDEEAIFHASRKIPAQEARLQYLEKVCAGDRKLQLRIEARLESRQQKDDFLKSADEPPPMVDSTATRGPGTVVDGYRILQKIGESSRCDVFVAEQERSERRLVAVKIIRAVVDAKRIVARFEANRRVLASLSHPQIAEILDVGSTQSKQPYPNLNTCC